MTTTEPTTDVEVPAWLKLDGYCPAEVHDKLHGAAADLSELVFSDDLVERIQRTYEAIVAFEHATADCHLDDHQVELGHLTGYTLRFR